MCPKCSKFYFKKAYFDKHIRENCCLKNINFVESSDKVVEKPVNNFMEIEDEIEKIALRELKSRQKQPIDIINDGMENIVNKVIMENHNINVEEISYLKKQMDLFKIEINLLKERVKILEKNEINSSIQNEEKPMEINNVSNEEILKIIRKEKVNISDEVGKQYLNYRSYTSDAELLYKIYLEGTRKDLIPIKKNKKNDCIFWNGNDWVEDNGGGNLKTIFSYNLKKIYTKVNVVEDKSAQSADYLLNQEYINNLSSKKYQQQLYSFFLEKYF